MKIFFIFFGGEMEILDEKKYCYSKIRTMYIFVNKNTIFDLQILMNAPSKIFVSLEHVIICLECFIVSAMMAMNWTEQEGTVQVKPV